MIAGGTSSTSTHPATASPRYVRGPHRAGRRRWISPTPFLAWLNEAGEYQRRRGASRGEPGSGSTPRSSADGPATSAPGTRRGPGTARPAAPDLRGNGPPRSGPGRVVSHGPQPVIEHEASVDGPGVRSHGRGPGGPLRRGERLEPFLVLPQGCRVRRALAGLLAGPVHEEVVQIDPDVVMEGEQIGLGRRGDFLCGAWRKRNQQPKGGQSTSVGDSAFPCLRDSVRDLGQVDTVILPSQPGWVTRPGRGTPVRATACR